MNLALSSGVIDLVAVKNCSKKLPGAERARHSTFVQTGQCPVSLCSRRGKWWGLYQFR